MPVFAVLLRELQPERIVVVYKGVETHVKRAAREAHLKDAPVDALPFPAMGHHLRYMAGLETLLRGWV